MSKTCIPPLVEKEFMLLIYLVHSELKTVKYMKYYKETAAAQDDLNHAIYSISEWQSLDNNGTKLISNPGCFPYSNVISITSTY